MLPQSRAANHLSPRRVKRHWARWSITSRTPTPGIFNRLTSPSIYWNRSKKRSVRRFATRRSGTEFSANARWRPLMDGGLRWGWQPPLTADRLQGASFREPDLMTLTNYASLTNPLADPILGVVLRVGLGAYIVYAARG